MADVNELTKLNRDQLNALAVANGIEDAADESKYLTKKDLAEALPKDITPEQVQEVVSGQKTENADQATEPQNETPSQEQAPRQEQPAPEQEQPSAPPIDSPEDVDDQSGVEEPPTEDDDVEEDDEPELDDEPTPRRRKASSSDEEGMGFPRKNGKTVSIFSNKPHETVRNVGGVMVPLTHEEYASKTDAEIQAKLRKLGKL